MPKVHAKKPLEKQPRGAEPKLVALQARVARARREIARGEATTLDNAEQIEVFVEQLAATARRPSLGV